MIANKSLRFVPRFAPTGRGKAAPLNSNVMLKEGALRRSIEIHLMTTAHAV